MRRVPRTLPTFINRCRRTACSWMPGSGAAFWRRGRWSRYHLSPYRTASQGSRTPAVVARKISPKRGQIPKSSYSTRCGNGCPMNPPRATYWSPPTALARGTVWQPCLANMAFHRSSMWPTGVRPRRCRVAPSAWRLLNWKTDFQPNPLFCTANRTFLATGCRAQVAAGADPKISSPNIRP